MIVTRIETALQLILDWAGRGDISIPERAPRPDGPPALTPLVAVSDALGPDFCVLSHHSAPLLSVQDTIFRPEDRQISEGIRLLVVENQGVWAHGYDEAAPDTLFVSCDWSDRTGSRTPESWRPVAAKPEDSLIAATLINGVFGLSERFGDDPTDDFDTIPPEANVLVWRHPAWQGWSGLWTNATRTLLHFGGFGLTLRRTT